MLLLGSVQTHWRALSTGTAPPLAETAVSPLTEASDSGEGRGCHTARSSPAPAGHEPALTAGLLFSGFRRDHLRDATRTDRAPRHRGVICRFRQGNSPVSQWMDPERRGSGEFRPPAQWLAQRLKRTPSRGGPRGLLGGSEPPPPPPPRGPPSRAATTV